MTLPTRITDNWPAEERVDNINGFDPVNIAALKEKLNMRPMTIYGETYEPGELRLSVYEFPEGFPLALSGHPSVVWLVYSQAHAINFVFGGPDEDDDNEPVPPPPPKPPRKKKPK